jgi:5-methylcytosine-specific restriction endonuclease McrA
MPIKPENRHRYPAHWPDIRAAILERAGHRCEQCGVPNRAYRLHGSDVWTRDRGVVDGWALDGERVTRVVLTIAHTDHMPENCHPTNLRALCQRCHLAYDAAHHAKTAYQTRRRGRALGDLFDAHL